MTDSIRDRIDRVIYDVWNSESGDEIPYLSPEAREALIDALLATFPILAGVPDELVEMAARAVADFQYCGSCAGAEVTGEWCDACTGEARAVLATLPWLAGVTDEMVEAGARGLTRHYFAEEGIYHPDEAQVTEHTVEPLRDIARAVLEAVYGEVGHGGDR